MKSFSFTMRENKLSFSRFLSFIQTTFFPFSLLTSSVIQLILLSFAPSAHKTLPSSAVRKQTRANWSSMLLALKQSWLLDRNKKLYWCMHMPRAIQPIFLCSNHNSNVVVILYKMQIKVEYNDLQILFNLYSNTQNTTLEIPVTQLLSLVPKC